MPLNIQHPFKILVICTGNSCRSQMAEGWLKYLGGRELEVYSAGLQAHGLNPQAVAAMQDAGVDISQQTSNLIEEYTNQPMDLVLTVCDHANEHCPFFPNTTKRVHQAFPDPSRMPGDDKARWKQFCAVRDDIRLYCQQLLQEHCHIDLSDHA